MLGQGTVAAQSKDMVVVFGFAPAIAFGVVVVHAMTEEKRLRACF